MSHLTEPWTDGTHRLRFEELLSLLPHPVKPGRQTLTSGTRPRFSKVLKGSLELGKDCTLKNSGLYLVGEAPHCGAANENTLGSQGQRLQHITAGPDASVQIDLDPALDRVHDLRQRINLQRDEGQNTRSSRPCSVKESPLRKKSNLVWLNTEETLTID